jgi:hypothetical protein
LAPFLGLGVEPVFLVTRFLGDALFFNAFFLAAGDFFGDIDFRGDFGGDAAVVVSIGLSSDGEVDCFGGETALLGEAFFLGDFALFLELATAFVGFLVAAFLPFFCGGLWVSATASVEFWGAAVSAPVVVDSVFLGEAERDLLGDNAFAVLPLFPALDLALFLAEELTFFLAPVFAAFFTGDFFGDWDLFRFWGLNGDVEGVGFNAVPISSFALLVTWVLTTSSLDFVFAFVVRFPLVTTFFAFLGLDFGFGELLTGLLLTLLFGGEPLFVTNALALFDFDFAFGGIFHIYFMRILFNSNLNNLDNN